MTPRSERDNQLRCDEHRSDQQMGRIVDHRGSPALEHQVTNGQQCSAGDHQVAVGDHIPAVVR